MTADAGEVVVDASVAMKWLVEEPGTAWAKSLAGPDTVLIAPELFLSECGNALWRLTRTGVLSEAEQQDAHGDLAAAPVAILACSLALHAEALRIATRLRHPVYDCLYLALALDRGAALATADLRFIRVLRAAGLLPPGRLLIPPA